MSSNLILNISIVIATLVACEIALRVPLLKTIKAMTGALHRAQHVIRSSRISDHWKELILPVYAVRLFKASSLLLVLMVLIVAPFGVAGVWLVGFFESLETLTGIAIMFGAAAVYVWLRAASTSAENYSLVDRVFHRIALGRHVLSEALFDVECSKFKARSEQTRDPVFVCGLARAGTTTLMRAFHETGQFASLTYQDMPLVMAPNVWAGLRPGCSKTGVRQERAHGDGVFVDFNSPEALDEVFWRTFCDQDYIGPATLVPHMPTAEILEKFRTYMDLICLRYQKPRYLSKNNNNILRLGALAGAYPDAAFLVLFRDPLAQAKSLLTQHRRFSAGSGFQKSYMTWLGHHEFGATHKRFAFGGEQSARDYQPDQVEYWLAVWCEVYGALCDQMESGPQNIQPVGYEALCDDPQLWPRLCSRLDVGETARPPFVSKNTPVEGLDESALLGASAKIYARLSELSQTRLNGA